MFEKSLAECGYCKYTWALRVNSIPKMCPRCKKRFKNAPAAPDWATKEVKIWTEKFESFDALRKKLDKLNE